MEQEYYKIIGKLDNSIEIKSIKNLLDLSEFIALELKKLNILKFVLVLKKFSLETDSVKADTQKTRQYKKKIQLSYLGIELNIDITGFNTEESSITIIQFNDSAISQNLFNDFKILFDKQLLPHNLRTLRSESSIYLIYVHSVTGQIWNIHYDQLKYKVHLPLTDCDENLVWYDNPTQKNQLKKLSFDKNVFYLLLVDKYHTIHVNKYIKDSPRVHLVADLEEL